MWSIRVRIPCSETGGMMRSASRSSASCALEGEAATSARRRSSLSLQWSPADDALADEGGIAVDEDGDDRQFRVAEFFLLGPYDPFEDAVGRFEVGGVGPHVHLRCDAVVQGVHAPSAEVVFHVPGALPG